MESPRRTTITILVILMLVIVTLAYVTYRIVTKSNVEESAAGQALLGAPGETAYISVSGVPIDLSQKLGQEALYINSWASWSPLSREELIALDTLAGEYKDRGISFIALNRKESKEVAERYLATLPPLTNLQVVIDSSDYFYGQVGGYAMPETLFFSKRGELWRHERQPLNIEAMRALVNTYLEESEE
jgi:thiol-disulfide isomerase/thioredoxin